MKFVNGWQKKIKRFITIRTIADTGLRTLAVITRRVSVAISASGVGLPDGIALRETSLLFSIATAVSRKSFKTFTTKQEKHGAIKLLAQSKLDRIVQCKTEASHLLRNIPNLRLILETKLKPM